MVLLGNSINPVKQNRDATPLLQGGISGRRIVSLSVPQPADYDKDVDFSSHCCGTPTTTTCLFNHD